jgi:hypothetical protein
MMKRRFSLSFVAVLGTVGAAIALAATGIRPGKPTIVCLLASSGAQNCPAPKTTNTSGGTMKWNPGHYIRVTSVSFRESDSERFSRYERIRNEPAFKGASVGITWGTLEPRKGVYDFSAIDTELNYMKAMGKRLIVEIWGTNFWHAMPTTPQRGNTYVPDYLVDEGLVVRLVNGTEDGGYTAAWSKPKTMDYFIPLVRALCERYNNEPGIEQFVFGETAVDGAKEFRRLVEPATTACSKTPTVLHMNWVDNPELARELAAVVARYGMGIGGPDVLPPGPSPYGEDHASLVLRGAGVVDGQNYGTIDYRGVVPVSFQYQAMFDITPAELIDYALNTQRVTHLTWTYVDYMGPEMNWSTGVLPAVKAQRTNVNTSCPTAYSGGCASN